MAKMTQITQASLLFMKLEFTLRDSAMVMSICCTSRSTKTEVIDHFSTFRMIKASGFKPVSVRLRLGFSWSLVQPGARLGSVFAFKCTGPSRVVKHDSR